MLAQFLGTYMGKLLLTAGMSMLPVIELRGAIPFGISLGLSMPSAFFASIIGNMIPVPFIILLIRRIFILLHTNPRLSSVIDRLESKAHIQGKLVNKYRLWGLCLLVAVPLPGTGAWTGALVADVLGLRLKEALPPILLGVILSGIMVSLATGGIVTAIKG